MTAGQAEDVLGEVGEDEVGVEPARLGRDTGGRPMQLQR